MGADADWRHFGNFEGGDNHLGRGGKTNNSDTLVTSMAGTTTWAGEQTINSDTLVTSRVGINAGEGGEGVATLW